MRQRWKSRVYGPVIFVSLCLIQGFSLAQEHERHEVNIPSQPLFSALHALYQQAGIQTLYEDDIVQGMRSQGARGNFTGRQAIGELLFGLPLKFEFTAPNTVIIAPVSTEVRGRRESANQSLPDLIVQALPAGQMLDQQASAAGRLGLTVREAPATIELIDQAIIETRGMWTVQEAAALATGVTYTTLPTSPGTYSMRGFALHQVPVLKDGKKLTQSSMVSRFLDSWNFDRIEIVKGPASVVLGEGAVGGAVNYVTKRPNRTARESQVGLSVGSFETVRAVIGSGGPLSSDTFYRVDYAYKYTDGWQDNNEQYLSSLTASLEHDFSDDLSVRLSIDSFRDNSNRDYGVPLLPASLARNPIGGVVRDEGGLVLDRSIIGNSYNVSNSEARSSSLWGQVDLNWRISDAVRFSGELYRYSGYRNWRNAERLLVTEAAEVEREMAELSHDHMAYGYRADLMFLTEVFGRPNRTVIGFDANYTEFDNPRYFSDFPIPGGTMSLFDPVPGDFLLVTENSSRTRFQTDINQHAIFMENALDVFSGFKLVLGARWEEMILGRETVNLNTGLSTANFSRRYSPTNYRVGGTYEAWSGGTLYGLYSMASDPIATLLLLSPANSTFDLTDVTQYEVGLRQSFDGGRGEAVLAWFDITRDKIITRDPSDPNLAIQGGSQSAEGLEISLSWEPTEKWLLSANYTRLDAKFDRLIEAGGVSRSGNLPPNVPEEVANLWVTHRFLSFPFELGVGARYVGERSANNANTQWLEDYVVYNAYAQYRFNDQRTVLTARVRNITDEYYATYIDTFYVNQVHLGDPRSYEIGIMHSF